MVCKKAEKVSWSSVRALNVKHPALLDYVLSRDLSHINSLEVNIEQDELALGFVDLDKYLQTLKKFSNLVRGPANLSSLVLEMDMSDNKYPEVDMVTTVAKLTNLNSLDMSFDLPEKEIDLGEAFKKHRALTRLVIESHNICTSSLDC